MSRREHPRYEGMEWPDWEFREYPMMIYPGAKNPQKPEYIAEGPRKGKLKFAGVTVNNDDELEAVLTGTAEIDPASGTVLSEDARRTALIEECQRLGLTIDKSWPIAKLERAMDEFARGDAEAEVV